MVATSVEQMAGLMAELMDLSSAAMKAEKWAELSVAW